jgi:hypothetical protein
MYALVTTATRGLSADVSPAWARYPTLEEARLGVAVLLNDPRTRRVMIVRHELPTSFVEWVER